MIGIIIHTLRNIPKQTFSSFERFRLRFSRPVRTISTIAALVTFVAAVAFVTMAVVYIGYDHTPSDYRMILRGIRCVQIIFILNVAVNILFNGGLTFRGARILSWILNISVLVTLLPLIYPRPDHPWIPLLKQILYSRVFLFAILTAYSVTDICYGITSVVSRRTNPSLILSASFIVFILLGTFLLMLPRSTYNGIGFHDALFLSTSAICITGLTPVDIPATLTPFGTIILAILIEVGALGVMTFTSFFAIFFTGTSSIYSQLMLRDIIYSKSLSSLIPTMFYILTFTVAIEAVGALCIFASIHGTLGLTLDQEIQFAAFHSLSAFCNAGFSTYPDGLSNPALLYGRQSFYWVVSTIIVAGAIGFPFLVNLRDVGASYLKRFHIPGLFRCRKKKNPLRQLHIYSVNTKVVLVTFSSLFIIGAVGFWLLERNNSLADLTPAEQLTQSVFNSVTPRSAGFSSVNPAGFLSPTLVMVMFLMWVGGASQSTAGGVKVNTLAAILLNLRAIVTGRDRVTAFRRTISQTSIRRANAVVAISILSYTLCSVSLLILEPALRVRDVLFESLSALFTVGSSLGVTAALSDPSKMILVAAMFLGRVGLISLMTGIVRQRRETSARFPEDSLIIN
ncbi:MAG: hypothetical protein NC336_03600 [Clostridium sp.]|nr:hypothetical protein [Clostridium sp.]